MSEAYASSVDIHGSVSGECLLEIASIHEYYSKILSYSVAEGLVEGERFEIQGNGPPGDKLRKIFITGGHALPGVNETLTFRLAVSASLVYIPEDGEWPLIMHDTSLLDSSHLFRGSEQPTSDGDVSRSRSRFGVSRH